MLPFGAKNADADCNPESKMVPRRLEKNAKLRRKLVRGYDRSGGTSIPFDHRPLIELFSIDRHKALRLLSISTCAWAEGFSATAAVFDGSMSNARLRKRYHSQSESALKATWARGTFNTCGYAARQEIS